LPGKFKCTAVQTHSVKVMRHVERIDHVPRPGDSPRQPWYSCKVDEFIKIVDKDDKWNAKGETLR
jgi:hypothetical protein